ncbi:MAG: isochorismatase family protein, partial [Chloroflexi bacterium]|nr:isochorismatase family protein [Chloroflexota bacterium]
TTARAASDRGIRCAIVEDGCAAFDIELHNATMRSFYLYGGDVRSTDEVIGELAARLAAAQPAVPAG